MIIRTPSNEVRLACFPYLRVENTEHFQFHSEFEESFFSVRFIHPTLAQTPTGAAHRNRWKRYLLMVRRARAEHKRSY